MEKQVRSLFERYESFFKRSLAGDVDTQEIANLYSTEFIAASPAGVMAGKNDKKLVQSMIQGYDYYRKIGTQGMRVRGLLISPIDELHCVAQVSWTATYARDDLPETVIEFDVHYFVQVLDGQAKVFGWVSGDEHEVLKRHGIV